MNKLSKFCNELSNHTDIKPEIYLSSATSYRARAEFGFSEKSYTMMESEQKIYMDKSSIPHPGIQEIMPDLLIQINKSKLILKKLFQINFRTSGTHVLATLIYHKPLKEDWILAAKDIQDNFKNLSLIGRSKKQKVLVNKEDLEVIINDANSSFKILQNDLVFFQPNFYLYSLMISFIAKQLEDPMDLLELYCGCGGFTLPLASKFNKVFATENNRHSIRLLKDCLLYTSPSPRDLSTSRMPSSA